MIQYQLKLRLKTKQEEELNSWLFMLTGVWNFAVRKIELDAKDNIYYTPKGFQNILADHGKKMGMPSHTVQGVLSTAYTAWQRCFKKLGGKPRLKGHRNKLNSVPFPDPIRRPEGNYIKLPGLGLIRFHKQELPEGKIKCGRIVKRASGWHLCLFIDAQAKPIPRLNNGAIGIDPGFKDLIAMSNGEKTKHPREYEALAKRLAQAQRGKDKKLTERLHERISNQRKNRNHKLSRDLVANNTFIAFSKDNIKGIANKFGKSVTSSSHAQLRSMIAYKSTTSGTQYIEVASKNSTRICSSCGSLTGPKGWVGLKVRHWQCGCGAENDRDVNAAINTLNVALGISVEAGVCHVG